MICLIGTLQALSASPKGAWLNLEGMEVCQKTRQLSSYRWEPGSCRAGGLKVAHPMESSL